FGKINNRINDLTKALKDAGFIINQTTGDIIELGRAETLLANKEIADNIRKQAEEEIKNRDEIISLINEYQNLNSIQNKNAVQRQRLSQLSEILQSKINGLIVVKDKEGNATIKNTGLLDKEISMLKTEGTTVETLTKVKLESAKQNATIQIGTTKTTYAQVKKRIAMYQEEMKALSSLTNGRMEVLHQKWKNGTITDAENAEYNDMQRGGLFIGGRAATNIHNLSGYIAEIDRIYGEAINGISLPNYGASEFTHPSDGSGSKKSKEPTKYTFDGKPLDMYEVKLQAINSQLENYDVIMNRIAKNTQKLQDIQSKDAYSQIIDLQIKKLGDLNSKQKVLESQRAELINKRNNGIIAELQRFTGNLKNKSVNDIARMTEEDWANLYNKMYGQDVFTGYDEAGQKKQKQYEENAQKFKQLIDNLKNYNKELHTNELAILDVENDINTTIKERLDWQEKLNELTSNDLADIAGDIQDKLDLLEIDDKTNYNEKIRLSQELLKAKKDELDFNTKARDSYSQQLKVLKEGTLEWNLIKEQVEVYNEKIDESTKNVQQLEKTLEAINKEKIDALASIEDEIVSALKNKYEKELELAKEAKAKELLLIKNLTDEQKKLLENGSKTRLEIFEEEHEQILKSLNDELKAYEDIYNTKIKEIDRQEDKDSYDKELNKKQQEKAKLQAQYDSLLMDSSFEARSKRTDLLEQIGLKEDEI
ncbi:MAG: hypothetical protein VB130_05395, partial [Clostridium sp.]|nr:hypothetical protein [Clostridium sp.]